MRQKSIEEVTSPVSSADAVSGITRALFHAAHMHRSGQLSDAERDDLAKYAMAHHLEHIEYNPGGDNRAANFLQENSGYADGEDPEEADARRHGVAQKVFVNLISDAAQRGDIKPKDALALLAAHAAHPGGDDQAAIMALLTDSSTPDKRMQPPGEPEMSDDELDAALEPVLSGRNAWRAELGAREWASPKPNNKRAR